MALVRACRPARIRRRVFLSVLNLEDRVTPSGIPTSWQVRGAGGGGALFSPAFNPANPNDIYVASDMSQVFHTTNAGGSWQTVDFRELGGGHEARVQFTNDPLIQYALDHTVIAGADTIRPTRTTNGGVTWDPTTDPTGGEAYYLFADPANANRLLITNYSQLFFSGDGGQTWSLKFTGDNGGAGLLVGGAFWDGSNIYLGTNGGLLVSTNGGQTFGTSAVPGLPAGHGILTFAGAKVGATTRFLAVTMPTGNIWAGVAGYELGSGASVATLDAGAASWTVRNLGAASAWPYYAGMALNDINTMYVAGGSSAAHPTVYKSSNGGGSWTSVLQTAGNLNVATGWSGTGGDRDWSYGEFALGFNVSPSDASKVIITDLGFAHSSVDGGATWQALYVTPTDRNPAGQNTPRGRPYHDSGLDNTTSWQVTWAGTSNLIISNSDIRGQLSLDGGQTFGFGYTGHTRNSLYRVATHANGTLYGAVASVHDLYQSTYLQDSRIDGGNGAVLFSTNAGVTWQTLHDFGRVVSWVAVDPTNPNRLFASVVHNVDGGIYVTNNLNAGSASTWTKLTNPPRTEGHPFNIVVLSDGTLVVSYSGRRNAAGGFTASSGVFVSTNGGQTWADRSAPGMLYWTKDVVVDPHDQTQNTWYAGVFSGWGGPPNGLGGLYKTTNRGVSWTRVVNLDRVTSVTFNPVDVNEAFLTTEVQGLWYSTHMRAATPTFTQVASFPFRQPERVFFNPTNANEIWVTSFGGGVRVGTTAAPPQVTSTRVDDGSIQRSVVRSLTVTFSAQVTLGAGAFVLTPQGGGPTVPLSVSSSTIGGVTVATITFPGTTGGSLADGNWSLRTVAAQVTDGSGTSMAADRVDSFFRRFGDSDGDHDVDLSDLIRFGAAYQNSGGYGAAFDFDGDGDVDLSDLIQFGSRYQVPFP